jgi:hypothetical protein
MENQIHNIFYDECKEDGYWHCFLFIPRNKIGVLYDLLNKSRTQYKYKNFIHYKNIGAKAKYNTPRCQIIQTWLYILYYILQQQKLDALIDWGNKNIERMTTFFGARLSIFRQKENHRDMFDKMSYQAKVEATFRMGLKNGLHFLFSKETPIIDKIYVDFKEEDFHKSFDENSLFHRIKDEVKSNISFTDDSKVIPISKEEYKFDCPISTIMQFVDVIIGSVRNYIEQQADFKARFKASKFLDGLLDKNTTNFARMRNSRFVNGISMTDAFIVDGSWEFEKLKKRIDNQQMSFNFFNNSL